jgi:hypothetical protein
MSELGSDSALGRCRLNVRIAPQSGRIADIPDRQVRAISRQSFNQSVRTQHEPSRYFVVDPFCRFEIDDQLELCRLLDRNVGRLGATQNFDNQSCPLAVQFGEARSIGHQPTIFGHIRPLVDRRQAQRSGTLKHDGSIWIRAEQRACQHIQRLGARSFRGIYRRRDCRWFGNRDDRKLDAAFLRAVFEILKASRCSGLRVCQGRNATRAGHRVNQKVLTLAIEFGELCRNLGDDV